MASIFNALNIGYSGLNAAQVGINTTGHNISNAEVEGYTRQRVVTAAATPLSATNGNVGNGTSVEDIKRVFDNFVFDRYTDVSSNKEYADFNEKTLEELSTYFPEIENVGIKADLNEYYNMWQTFADNPDNDAIKLALAKQTETLSDHISYTQSQVKTMQAQLNDQLEVNINEVNSIAEELAGLNQSIDTAESGDLYSANDLRDRRNVLEKNLAKLIGAETNSGILESNIQIDTSSNTKTGSYTVNVNGFNIVDGNSFHPIRIDNQNNEYGFFDVSFERQDGTLIPIAESITGGKVGAILDLRGAALDSTSGQFTDGTVQNVVSQMDSFAKTLIETTNNLYAAATTDSMTSNFMELKPQNSIISSGLNVNDGSFNLNVYDIDGNIAATREISIDVSTSVNGTSGSNSIEGQISANVDDNDDSNATNDVDDFINFSYKPLANGDYVMELQLDPLSQSKGYTFSISDNLTSEDFASGTNFAGAFGLSRFFDGNNAQNIELNNELKDNPTMIKAGYSATSGDNRVALNMVQHQYEKYDFNVGGINYNTSSYGMFDIIATEVGAATNTAITQNQTITAQYNSVELEYSSVSKVSIDEEMTNLIKYQTSYGAAAKVITTIDQMMNTLLGIKQ